ncbi:MAG: hypothetical protein IJM62_07385 [Lachnospiraceae bacterium]|nr:hypothetical protein [Lachnospiraceae bacterium]
MSAEYRHIGIPVLHKKPNMMFNEWGKFWVSEDVNAHDYVVEYLKFEEETQFPDILQKVPHVAFTVDDAEPYIRDADRVIIGPLFRKEGVHITFIMKDDVLIELYEDKR